MRTLPRKLGLLTLTATGICSMLGASVYVVPFMIHRSVPGIDGYVLPAFLFAAIPALLAAFAYASLSTAMPRAGGSYLYASRGLHPYLGFVASFSQWFGLSIVIGVIAYIIVPFVRDVTLALGWEDISTTLEVGWVRVCLALMLVWTFVWINIKGARSYSLTLLPMMFIMFALGAIVIAVGFSFDHEDFYAAVGSEVSGDVGESTTPSWMTFLSAAALLFSSFIGFDSIAQAGGEARNPTRNLPRAILLAIFGVGAFYFVFAGAVYHTVPWQYVADVAKETDTSAPGLLQPVLPTGLSVAILAGAALALINDLPAMLLSVSRLMFAWAEDRVFPARVADVHQRYGTPYRAIVLAGIMASVGILGSHFAGDFFLGIDIMVTSMLVNFLLMCLTLLTIEKRNPILSSQISIFGTPLMRRVIGILGVLLLGLFLVVHTVKDLQADVSAWYFHSTWIWLLIVALASAIFYYKWIALKSGTDLREYFKKLPEE